MARGMLDIFNPDLDAERQAEQDREKQLQYLAEDPWRAARYSTYKSAADIGPGIANVAGTLAGRDMRSASEKHKAAIEAAKAEVAAMGFNPDDPKTLDQFYKGVMLALQKQGLAGAAAEIAKEWRASKVETSRVEAEGRKADLAAQELARKQKADEERVRLGELRIASGQEIALARAATQKDIAEAKLTAEQAKTGPFKAIDYADHVDIINKNGQVISSKPKGLAPRDVKKGEDAQQKGQTAFTEYLAGMQDRYNTVVELHNHPGLAGITGRFGQYAGEPGFASALYTIGLTPDRALNALAVYDRVAGGAFLSGLAKLKEASKTGATGLGAVSEREGDKVQSDAAALRRAQQTEAMRAQLKAYADSIAAAAQRAIAGAQAGGLQPGAFEPKQLVIPSRRGRATMSAPLKPAAPATPAPAPAAPAAPASKSKIEELLQKYPPKR